MSDFTALFWDEWDVCIGDTGEDPGESHHISDKLKKAFSEWHSEFEKFGDKKPCPIDWKKYNQVGRVLTQRLQKELGSRVKVVYQEPFESEF